MQDNCVQDNCVQDHWKEPGMTLDHRSGASGASGAMTLDRAAPSAAAAAPIVTAGIPVGSESDAVAVSPLTGDVYITNFNDGTVSVISGQTNTVTAAIPVGTSPDGSRSAR